MAKKGKQRPQITLACTVCNSRNYQSEKNSTNTPGRFEINKYCGNCRKHTLHKEAK